MDFSLALHLARAKWGTGIPALDGADTTPPHLTAAISHTQVHADPYPHPVTWPAGTHDILRQIFEAGRRADPVQARIAVESLDLLRTPPLVQQYRAEVLAWMDRHDMTAYHRKE
jgi:hypothetical protein